MVKNRKKCFKKPIIGKPLLLLALCHWLPHAVFSYAP